MRVVQRLALAVCFCASASAQTVQQLRLPTPVAFEAVIPHVVFGSAGLFQFVTEVTLVNGTNDQAFIEFELLDSQGVCDRETPGRDKRIPLGFRE